MAKILFICTTTLILYDISSRLARKIRNLEGRIERDEMHHWQLVYELNKLKKENEADVL